MGSVPSAITQTPMKMTSTWIHTWILLLFNTVVTRRYALCIKYNQYAQPQKICHQGSYKLHGNFQELQISIQSKNKDHMKQRSYAHSMFLGNIHKLLVCLSQLYESIYTIHDGPSETVVLLGGVPPLKNLQEVWRIWQRQTGGFVIN